MKSKLTLLILGINLISLYSQDKPKRYELGLNITNTFKSIFSINADNSLLNDPYTISIKVRTGKTFVRMGTFFSISGNEDFSDLSGGLRNINEKSIGFRLGIEGRSNAGKRLEFLYGLDLLSNYTDRITTQQFFDEFGNFFEARTGNKIPSFGIGPVLGLIFNLNSHVSIFTESSLYFIYTKNTKVAKLDPSKPEIRTIAESWKIQHLIPQSLFVAYKF